MKLWNKPYLFPGRLNLQVPASNARSLKETSTSQTRQTIDEKRILTKSNENSLLAIFKM